MKTVIVPPAAPTPVKISTLKQGDCYSLPDDDNVVFMVTDPSARDAVRVVDLQIGNRFSIDPAIKVNTRQVELHVEALSK